MKYSKEILSATEVKIKIEADGKALAPYLEKAFKEEVKDIEEDGFRKGKMTRAAFDKKFGVARLYPTAIDFLLNDNYIKLVEQENIEPVSSVKFDYEKMSIDVETGFSIEGTVSVMPDFKLGDYKALIKDKKVINKKVEKKAIDENIKTILEGQAMLLAKDGAIVNGDTAVINFEGFLDGVAFEGGKGEAHPLEIGSNSFIPGFEEKLIGAQIGENIDVSVTFPENYQAANLAGQPVIFKCEILEIKGKEIPALTDEAVSEMQGYDVSTVADFKVEVTKRMQEEADKKATQDFHNDLIKTIAASVDLTIPENVIDEEIESTLKSFEGQLKGQGMDLNSYQEMMKITLDDMKKDVRPDIERRLKESLVLKKIVELEKIEVTDADLDAKLVEMAAMYGMEVENIKSMLGDNLKNIRDEIKFEKVFTALTV